MPLLPVGLLLRAGRLLREVGGCDPIRLDRRGVENELVAGTMPHDNGARAADLIQVFPRELAKEVVMKPPCDERLLRILGPGSGIPESLEVVVSILCGRDRPAGQDPVFDGNDLGSHGQRRKQGMIMLRNEAGDDDMAREATVYLHLKAGARAA